MSSNTMSIYETALQAEASSRPIGFLATSPVGFAQRRLALVAVLVSVVIFVAAAPFAKRPLTPLPAFIPIYESALVICDLITAVLLFGQYNIMRSRALIVLAAGYLFTAFITVAHALTFPGLFAPTGLLGAGPQSTAWIYEFWHGGFPLLVIAYALLKSEKPGTSRTQRGGTPAAVLSCVMVVLATVCGFTLLATAGQDSLPPIMQGNGYTPALIIVISIIWAMSLIALAVLWRRPPHSVLDLWLMVVMCAWLFDIALAGVLNAGRYDLGWYAGRAYGLLAASFVLIVLLLENGKLHAELLEARSGERAQAREALARQAERLRILHDIDRAIIAEAKPEAIAVAVLQPLRELLGVPRVNVNMIDHASGEVEWLAAAGRRRTHIGPGVRFSLRLIGDLEALKRGEPQTIDTQSLPPGPETQALLASGVHFYMAVPMIAGGELIGALSFGGEQRLFPTEQAAIAQEVATQLAIAIAQARLFERVKRQAERDHRMTAELESANRQLRESERRFSDLLGNVQLVSVMLDRDARITYCNEYLLRLTGWRYEEVIGRSWVELFIPPETGDMKDRLAVLLADQSEGRHGDNKILTRSGERRLIRWNNSVLRSGTGDVIGTASIGEDITERERAEQEIRDLNASLERRVAERTRQLDASNKELESFSYSVSHDLRAPLRAIDGYAQMLNEDYGARLDAEGTRLLGVVRESAAQMARLIDDLLKFAQVGRKPLARSPLDMRALAHEVVGELAQAQPKARIELQSLPAAAGDRVLLKQVWTNLIGNALKYSASRESPHVEVGGRADAAENVYWVRDNGAGFDMRYYEKLFQVFQRLHSDDEFEGTGVGLAIVLRVIARHGGRVWGEGALGAGACFSFALPKDG